MTAEQAVAFLEALRAKNIRVKDNGWVEASCVLARWTHKDRTDHSPSFGLSISPGDRSHFMCFACRQGSAEELLSSLEMYTQSSKEYNFARCHQLLDDEQFVTPLPQYSEFTKADQAFEAWPQYWLDSFQKAEWVDSAMKYLISRDVSMTTIKEFDLRFDPKRQMILSPYRDVFGRLAGARGRAIDDSAAFKHYDYSWQSKNNARLCWFNEQVLNLTGPVVIVEGQFDCMRTVQAYPKTLANLTAKPSWEKMKKLSDSSVVIQIPDSDAAGAESVYVYAKFCHQLGLQHRVVHLDPGVKDPDQCAVEYLKDRIMQLIART